jgi:ATP-dependent DNA helicase RecG
MSIQFELPFTTSPLPLMSADEIFSQADIGLLRSLNQGKEDHRLERKPQGITAPVLGEYFSMWANTEPEGGLTILGIEKDSVYSGCAALSQKQLNNIETARLNDCPDARAEFKKIPFVDDNEQENFLFLIRVFYREDKVVMTVSGDAFIRVGDEKRKLNADEIQELKIDKNQVDFEQEPVQLQFPEDFDTALVSTFTSSIKNSRQLLASHPDIEILTHRRLGKMNGSQFTPNNSCALLFAKDPLALFPGFKIRFLRYDGTEERTGQQYNVVKDIQIEGPIPHLISEAAEVIASQLRQFSHLEKDGKFYTVPEYPVVAWYEAVVNACVHRSYGLRNMNIFVKLFEDRLVVESPGGFPPFVTPENIYTQHHPRNPRLMDAMYYLDLVKCHNEGTRRMKDALLEMGLPMPEFAQKEVAVGYMSVRVTLRNNVARRRLWAELDVARIIGESIVSALSSEETKILAFVAQNNAINVSECQRQISTKTWHAARAVLLRLTEKGILEHQRAFDRDPKAQFVLAKKFKKTGRQ